MFTARPCITNDVLGEIIRCKSFGLYISSCTYDVLLCNKAATLCTRTPEATQKLSFHTTIPEPKRWTVDQETPTRQHGIQQKCTEWDAGWDVGLPNIARILGVYSS
jgi:hypothetical protein